MLSSYQLRRKCAAGFPAYEIERGIRSNKREANR